MNVTFMSKESDECSNHHFRAERWVSGTGFTLTASRTYSGEAGHTVSQA
jgi:hypothetical protein